MPLILTIGERRVSVERALVLGADRACDVVVAGLAVRHARLRPGDGWTLLEPEGQAEVSVGEVHVLPGESRALVPGDRVRLGPVEAEVTHEETQVPAGTAELALVAVRRARRAPRVLVVGGPSLGAHRDLDVEGQPVRLGRGKSCDWVIADASLSRAHARLVLRRGEVLVRDLGSARGTFLGASRLEPQKEATWDRGRALRVGDTVLALLAPVSTDEIVGELAADAPESAPSLVAAAVEPEASPQGAAPSPAGAGPLANAPPTGHVADARPRDDLRRAGILALGVAFIAACVAVLLWVLGAFSGGS